jgi:hypothetical protein
MRAGIVPLVITFLALAWFPAPFTAADGPAGLPDLLVTPDDILFAIGDRWIRSAPVGAPSVWIWVAVESRGPGNVTSVNVTFEVNGTSLGTAPAVVYSDGGTPVLVARFNWSTGALPAGVFGVRATANDSSGDADPSDNSALANITFMEIDPRLAVILDGNGVVEAPVSESAACNARVTGNLTASELWGRTLDISLESRMDINWGSEVSPATFHVTGDSRIPFSADVTLPPATPAALYGTLNITASGRAGNSTATASAQAIVKVRPYFRFTLIYPGSRNISPGNNVYFLFTLTNAGNSADSYEVEINNTRELENKKWNLHISSPMILHVELGGSGSFWVEADSPRDWTLSTSTTETIIVQVTSTYAKDFGQDVSQTARLVIHVEGSYPPWDPLSSAVVILAAVVVAGILIQRRKRRSNGEPGNRGPYKTARGGLIGREDRPEAGLQRTGEPAGEKPVAGGEKK